MPSPPGCPGACSPELAGSSPLPVQVAEGHAVRCVPARGSQRNANQARHRGLDRRRPGLPTPVVSAVRWRGDGRSHNLLRHRRALLLGRSAGNRRPSRSVDGSPL